MRIFLYPTRRRTTISPPATWLSALRAQNLQSQPGILNQPPTPSDEAYQINVEALGAVHAASSFAQHPIRPYPTTEGRVTRVRDIGRFEIAPRMTCRTSSWIAECDALVIYAEFPAPNAHFDVKSCRHAGAEEGLSARRRLLIITSDTFITVKKKKKKKQKF